MLDEVFKLIQGPVANAIKNSNEVPEEKKEIAIHSTTNAIADTLQQHITPDNISKLSNLFTGGTETTASSNFLTDGITSTIVNVLSQKIGISKTAATAIASAIIPTLMNTLTSKVSGSNKSGGIDIGSLIGMLTGGNSSSSNKGNVAGEVIGALGRLFNK